MKYLVLEMQVSADGSLAQLSNIYDKESEAQSKFHTILAAAALSGLPVHSAVILLEDGTLFDKRTYRRDSENGGDADE